MRRMIARALMFFILFANLAWAADMDDGGLFHKDIKVLSISDAADGQATDGSPGPDTPNHAPCDHCCHGSAHYVGLTQTALLSLPSARCAVQRLWLDAVYSHDKEPPLPPPNI